MEYFNVFFMISQYLRHFYVIKKTPKNISGFRKGVWGTTLFPPEKGFPQKGCPD